MRGYFLVSLIWRCFKISVVKFISCLLLFNWTKYWMYFSFIFYLCIYLRSKLLLLLLFAVTIKLTRWSVNGVQAIVFFVWDHLRSKRGIICGRFRGSFGCVGIICSWGSFAEVFSLYHSQYLIGYIYLSGTRLIVHSVLLCFKYPFVLKS